MQYYFYKVIYYKIRYNINTFIRNKKTVGKALRLSFISYVLRSERVKDRRVLREMESKRALRVSHHRVKAVIRVRREMEAKRVRRGAALSYDGAKVQDDDVPVEPGDDVLEVEPGDSIYIHNKDSTKACNDTHPLR